MSSDDEIIDRGIDLSDIDDNLEPHEELQDQEPQTEEVLRDENAEAEDAEEDDANKKKVKPKRSVRNPLPKLNGETLKGPRGITAIENYFQRVKFKGKGYEHQDLDIIMKTYEYWCHRLFPKFPFDTCIERLEKLGSKKAVQTHIRRIRFDLIVEDKPLLSDSDDEPNVQGFVDIQNEEINQQQNQQFDQLLNSSAPPPAPVELTEEQLERIRLNKDKAERLRQERLKKIRDKAAERLKPSTPLPETSGMQSCSRFEQLESSSNTQSDIFSQEYDVLRTETSDLDSRESLFDHESSVKGKQPVKGTLFKKKSCKNNISGYDSGKEHNDNENHDAKDRKDDISDSESDQGMEVAESNGKTNTLISSDDENSVVTNVSFKRKPKLTALLDSDESDLENDGNNQNMKINNIVMGSEENSLSNEEIAKTGLSQQKRIKNNSFLDSDDSDQHSPQSVKEIETVLNEKIAVNGVLERNESD